jgi:hypothetical protein
MVRLELVMSDIQVAAHENLGANQTAVKFNVRPVAAGTAILSPILAVLDSFWRAVQWVWTTLILGGLIVSVLGSYITTGSPGLSDPQSWVTFQIIQGFPEQSLIVLAAAASLTLLGFVAHMIRPIAPNAEEVLRFALQRYVRGSEHVQGLAMLLACAS